MNYTFLAIPLIVGLLAGILLMMSFGRRIGLQRLAQHGDNALGGVAAIDGAVFALLGLLLAFTFSGAASRFDTRRQQIVEESNDIGTAYLRIDLLPAGAQPAMRELFRRYADSRISVYRKMPDFAAVRAEMATSADLQHQIWTQAVTASGEANSPSARTLLLPAINAMIDITNTRTVAAQIHPPAIVFVILVMLVLAGSFLAGHSMASTKYRGRVHMLCFAIVMTATVYVILDFEFPRIGLMRIDSFDQLLIDVRTSMN